MNNTSWYRQSGKALFADLEWNKPERRDHAGHILIIGGHLHALGAPASAFETVKKTGVNKVTLALPESTKKLVGHTHPEAFFLPSTQSGELSLEGRHELEGLSASVDLLLLPGDTGRNSQTTQLLEQLLRSVTTPAIITKDSLDSFIHQPQPVLERAHTTLITSFAQLQKIAKHSKEGIALTYQMNLEQLVEFLHHFTQKYPISIATLHHSQLLIASHGTISTTKLLETKEPPHWRVIFAALASNYQTWNPNKPFEALTQAAHKSRELLH